MKKRFLFGLVLVSLFFIIFSSGLVRSAQVSGTPCEDYTSALNCIAEHGGSYDCVWEPSQGFCWDGSCAQFSGNQTTCDKHSICCSYYDSSSTLGDGTECINADSGQCGKTHICYYAEQDKDKDNFSLEGSFALQVVNRYSSCEDAGYISLTGDCNDSNNLTNPGVSEICNDGIDNNCNSQTDCNDWQCSSEPVCQGTNPPQVNLYWANSSNLNLITNANKNDKVSFVINNSNNFDSSWTYQIWEEDDSFLNSDDLITTISDEINFSTKVIVNWTITQTDIDLANDDNDLVYDFYFKVLDSSGAVVYDSRSYVNGILNVSKETNTGTGTGTSTSECSSILSCSDYTDSYNCTQNLCSIDANISGTCNSPSSSQCAWVNQECVSQCVYMNENTGETEGYCNYKTILNGDCSTSSFISYSLEASWIPFDLSSPSLQPRTCANKTGETITCPSQTKLPLTSFFGIILTIIVIGFGYLIFNKNGKKS